MSRALVATLALLVLGASAQAAAQEPEHVVASYALAPGRPVLLTRAATVRVVVRGSFTCSIDASEIDAEEIAVGGQIRTDVRPLLFPDDARLVERRGPHEYLVELPPGPDALIAVNTPALAAHRLVTASELDDALVGAITLDVLASPPSPRPLSTAAAVVAQPRVASLVPGVAFGGSLLGLSLVGVALALARRRRETIVDAAARRARAAYLAIVREARVLGAGFAGALDGAAELERSARAQVGHVRALDRALVRTAWVSGAVATAERATLLGRRDDALARLATLVACLEESVVRMAACVADRSAIAGLERDMARVRGEVDIGESVERELADLSASRR